MVQLGLFDLSRRYEGLDAKNDPLVMLARVVPWERFRPTLLAALTSQDLCTSAAERRSSTGRKLSYPLIFLQIFQ